MNTKTDDQGAYNYECEYCGHRELVEEVWSEFSGCYSFPEVVCCQQSEEDYRNRHGYYSCFPDYD